MSLSLSGSWRLKTKGSDYVAGIEMIDTTQKLTITQMSRPNEEVHFVHDVSGKKKQAYYQLGRIAFEAVTPSVVLAAVVNISEDFREISILRMGPDVGQRSLEQFKLADNGNEIRVEVDHILPESESLKLVKILQRVPESFITETIPFHTISIVNNWAFPQSHAPSTVRSVQLRFVDCIEVVTNGAVARRASLAKSDSFGPSSPMSSPSKGGGAANIGSQMRRFNGELSSGETVQLFVAEISVGTLSWTCHYRYRELDAFRNYINDQLKDTAFLNKLPQFPGKSFGKLRGKSLDARKAGLESYLTALCASGGFNILNISDALASLLEIPEHTLDAMAVPKAQAVLRQQMLGNFPSFDSQPELYPKHVLSSMLGDGLRVLKYGRRGKPKERVLFRSRDDEDLLSIYWVDQADLGEDKKRDANGVPHGARCIQLRAVMEIRRGTAIDPSHSEFCGTPILRKNCEPADYAYCVSLICHDRTLDFKMLSREDYDSFVPNLLKHHEALLQNDTGGYGDLYDEVAFRK